ncbi:MAG: hypothetical protein NVSMB27_25300 [Ktedonobacteraceae bacterium]
MYRTYERDQLVIRISSMELFYHMTRKVETHPPLPQIRNGAFIPSHEWRRDFPRRFVKYIDAERTFLDLCGHPW